MPMDLEQFWSLKLSHGQFVDPNNDMYKVQPNFVLRNRFIPYSIRAKASKQPLYTVWVYIFMPSSYKYIGFVLRQPSYDA